MQLHMPIHREMLCICSYQCGSVLWYLFVYQRDYKGLLAMRIFICWLILYSFCGMTFSIQWLHNAFRKQTQELQKINKQTSKPNQTKPSPTQPNPNQQTNKQTNKQTKKQRTKGNKQEKETKKDRNNEANKQRYELVKATPCNTSLEKVATSSLATSISALQCTLFEAFVCDVKCCLCCLFQDEAWWWW